MWAVVGAAEAAGLIGSATPPAMVQGLLQQRVEEDGKNLSGGIAKAIAFARIFVKPSAELGVSATFIWVF
jgi:ABC-type multidrug transport system fused ATPase/permease subunit